jgi:hypothetical protein
MRVWPLAARYTWFRAWAEEAARRRASREEPPLRTIYNSRTGQFEDMPLPEFQQLLLRGEIQEAAQWKPDGGRRYTYRLV